jgi:hypothetical protein
MYFNNPCKHSVSADKCSNTLIRKSFFGLGPRYCVFSNNSFSPIDCKHFEKKSYEDRKLGPPPQGGSGVKKHKNCTCNCNCGDK